MTRRTGKEGLYQRVVADKRRNFLRAIGHREITEALPENFSNGCFHTWHFNNFCLHCGIDKKDVILP